MAKNASHESYEAYVSERLPSNRNFGMVMATFFALVGVLPLRTGSSPRIWAFAVSAAFFLTALIAARVLGPLNWLWSKLGLLMGHVVASIVMAILFFAVFTPLGFFLQRAGRRPLRLNWLPAEASYWIVRPVPGPAPDSLRRQF